MQAPNNEMQRASRRYLIHRIDLSYNALLELIVNITNGKGEMEEVSSAMRPS
jgi:hypothetical protein